uniref:Uncharacterized protein n=1 Tax=Romanomermis culicivorax TaxID=13658 RepID=A0A915LCR3_ROMCU
MLACASANALAWTHLQVTPGFIEHSSNFLNDGAWRHRTHIRTDLVPNMKFSPDDTVEAYIFVPYIDDLYIVTAFKSERISAYRDDVLNDTVDCGRPLYYFVRIQSEFNLQMCLLFNIIIHNPHIYWSYLAQTLYETFHLLN